MIWTGEEEGDRGALERELPGLACYQSTILKCFKWYCMVWNGMVWYGMVGMVWYGVLPSSNASTYSIPVSGKVKILMKSQSYGFHVTHPIHVAQRRWLRYLIAANYYNKSPSLFLRIPFIRYIALESLAGMLSDERSWQCSVWSRM